MESCALGAPFHPKPNTTIEAIMSIRKSNRKALNRPNRIRRLFEQLEDRIVLTGWTNFYDAMDVNNDGLHSAVDALLIVNRLNEGQGGDLEGQAVGNDPLLDVDRDNRLSPTDALIVVNSLNDAEPVQRNANIALTDDDDVQQMPSVAIDPTNAQNVAVAYMDYSLVETGYAGIAISVSKNGGTSWVKQPIPVPEPYSQGAASPVLQIQ